MADGRSWGSRLTRIYQQTFIDTYFKLILVKLYDRKHAIISRNARPPGVAVLLGTRRAAVGTFPVWFAFVIMLLRGEGFPLRVAQFTSRLNILSNQ